MESLSAFPVEFLFLFSFRITTTLTVSGVYNDASGSPDFPGGIWNLLQVVSDAQLMQLDFCFTILLSIFCFFALLAVTSPFWHTWERHAYLNPEICTFTELIASEKSKVILPSLFKDFSGSSTTYETLLHLLLHYVNVKTKRYTKLIWSH